MLSCMALCPHCQHITPLFSVHLNLNVSTRYCSLWGSQFGMRSYWPLNMVASQHDLIPTATARAIKFRNTKYRCLYDNFQLQKTHYIKQVAFTNSISIHGWIKDAILGHTWHIHLTVATSEYIAESGMYIWQLVVD